jgi:TPR repeat protein
MSLHTLGSRFSIMAAMMSVVLASALPVRPVHAAVKNAEDLFIVDCLLPGQIRSLGRVATFMSARRPVRASQAECQIRGGEYVSYDRANYQTALKVWLDQANAGSAEAQNNVGEIYSKGLGTEPDFGMAYQWFKKAADQGFNRAKINLGYLYEEGLGVAKDPAAALNLYREASGIQDDLLYSSVVEVEMKAKDDKIGTLQTQVESEKANSAELREQLKRTQEQLGNQRRALQQSQAQLQQTQSQLQQAKQQKDDELTKLLENQMLGQEQQINAQRQQIATLERRAGGVDATLFAGGANFSILEPSLVATRGRNTAIVRGPGKRNVVGRVASAKTIKQVTVNGAPISVAANGTFNAEIDVAQAGTAVKVVALEQSGVRGELQFTMLPQTGGNAGSSIAASGSGGVGSLPRDVRLGRYFAVVIGNNTYRDAQYPGLKSAVSDATAVSNLLQKRYGYQTTLVLNASRLEMLTALSAMRDKMKPEDNLLVYYAGHGELNGATGYWVPTDGAANNTKSWISNAAISDILNTMPAKHIMVVADSCYSGSMTGAAVPNLAAATTPDKWNAYVKTMASGRSRTALTSGGVQPVPDSGSGNHSYFARAFLNALQDNNRLMEAQRLFREVSTSLALNSINSPLPQNPQYAPIRYAGHESGDFFFMPKGAGS